MDRVSSHVKLQASCSGGSGASNLDLAVVRLAAQPAAAAHKGFIFTVYYFKCLNENLDTISREN